VSRGEPLYSLGAGNFSPFFNETFGLANSFLERSESTPREIMDLGLEKKICEKK
jgi:hypothetical protein